MERGAVSLAAGSVPDELDAERQRGNVRDAAALRRRSSQAHAVLRRNQAREAPRDHCKENRKRVFGEEFRKNLF